MLRSLCWTKTVDILQTYVLEWSNVIFYLKSIPWGSIHYNFDSDIIPSWSQCWQHNASLKSKKLNSLFFKLRLVKYMYVLTSKSWLDLLTSFVIRCVNLQSVFCLRTECASDKQKLYHKLLQTSLCNPQAEHVILRFVSKMHTPSYVPNSTLWL